MHECKTVTLRTRPLKGRMLSFYLDYYPGYRDKETMRVIRHETLGIYLYADPKNKREQNFNEVMTEKAEAIRCRRFAIRSIAGTSQSMPSPGVSGGTANPSMIRTRDRAIGSSWGMYSSQAALGTAAVKDT